MYCMYTQVCCMHTVFSVWLSPRGLIQVDYVKPYLLCVCLWMISEQTYEAGPPSAESGSPLKLCIHQRLIPRIHKSRRGRDLKMQRYQDYACIFSGLTSWLEEQFDILENAFNSLSSRFEMERLKPPRELSIKYKAATCSISLAQHKLGEISLVALKTKSSHWHTN